jgi:signal transduction histidine kinase
VIDERMVSSASKVANRPVVVNARYSVAVTAAVGFAVTLVITSAGWEPAYQNRALHGAKETVAALVLLLVAALLAGRVARRGTWLDLLALAGVLVLATKNLFFSVFTAIVTETAGGLTTWRTTGAGMIGAALLTAAALSRGKVVRDSRKAILIAVGCSLGCFVLLSGIAGIFHFPGALTARPDSDVELRLLDDHAALIVADVVAAALFLTAGAAFARRAEREDDELQMWLGIGTTIAAIGYLNYALSPSAYTDFLYAGDLFRAAAVVAMGIGAMREYSRYQAVYAPAAVLEERRQMARNLHEGVAQELAFIASRMHRLADEAADKETIVEVDQAVRRALSESRMAISTLNRPLDEPLHVALAHTAREVVGPTDARLELDLDPDVVVPAVWAHALPKIVREAVSNAVQHGRPRTVRVHLRDADGIWLRVTDDGDGFDPSAPPAQPHFGLISVKEQTESLGGEFKLWSAPGIGTSLDILLP